MENITNKIVDIHNHSLFGVDDGAKTIEEAVENISYLRKFGVTDIVLTSHYIPESKYQSDVISRKNILREIKKATKDMDVNLYLGNEVFVSNKIIELLNTGKITTLNESKYILIEFPMNQSLHYIEDIVCELNDYGLIPVIAHPERYSYFKDNYKRLDSLLEYNCILQCNIESIAGKYGNGAKKIIKMLLKDNKVKVLATDFHHFSDANMLDKSMRKLRKVLSSDKLNLLLYLNPLKIINNENL